MHEGNRKIGPGVRTPENHQDGLVQIGRDRDITLDDTRRAGCPAAERGSVQWRLSGARVRRHTAASQAVMAGENLPLVGRFLGHRRHRTTAAYSHVADAHLVAAAEKVDTVIANAMAHLCVNAIFMLLLWIISLIISNPVARRAHLAALSSTLRPRRRPVPARRQDRPWGPPGPHAAYVVL